MKRSFGVEVAKLVVVKSDGDRIPFLRGIMVQSLVSAGLSFQDAYAMAQLIREDLVEFKEISSAELTARVTKHLDKRFGAKARRAYETEREREQGIMIRGETEETPFSVGILTRSLRTCLIDKNQALEAARKVHKILKETGHKEIDHLKLRRTIYRSLENSCSKHAANLYLSWRQFKNSGDPLILLVGGATGTGKSTITSKLAYRLDVVRTQSTDMMRQIIRSYLAPHVAPTLAYSSFEAWRGLSAAEPAPSKGGLKNPVVAGFMAQFATIKVALEATIERAVKERHDLIIDGVHVIPTELDLAEASQKAIIIPILLVVTTREKLARQLVVRSRDQPERGASRYLRHLNDIWELQTYLLKLADKAGIPEIANWDIEDTLGQILNEVNRKISERYPPDPHALA